MKKLLILSLIIAMFSMQRTFAQGYQITINGTDITNSIFYAWFDMSVYSQYTLPVVTIKNTGTTTKSVKVYKMDIDTLTHTTNSFCWVGCYSSITMESPSNLSIAPNASTTSFVGDYTHNNVVGESIIKYRFVDVNTQDSAFMIVHYNATPTGINQIAAANTAKLSTVFPNPASDNATINYSLGQGNGQLDVINMLGQTKSSILLGVGTKTTTLSLCDYAPGIYFVALKVNGVTADIKRFSVK